MALNLKPVFGYTILYVKDVAKSVEFYAKAFGYHVRRLDDSHRWGELESGNTTIAFTPIHQNETDNRTGEVQTPQSASERPPVEVCFSYADVEAAYKQKYIITEEGKSWVLRSIRECGISTIF